MEIAGHEMRTEVLDHHGIVAGLCRELRLDEKINGRIGSKDPRRAIQPGIAVIAMIINGLGFSNRRLYLTPQFFENKPLEALFGQTITAEQLDDHALGKCLDEIVDYGPTQLFGEIAFEIAVEKDLLGSTSHLDSTSFSLSGQYDTDEPETIEVTHGFSKDHRPDLKQVMLSMVCNGPANLPIWIEPQNGNSSDAASFHQTAEAVKAYHEQLLGSSDMLWVADAAFYNKDKLASYEHMRWISRVPETIGIASHVVAMPDHAFHWTTMEDGVRYTEIGVIYGKVRQRWIMVSSQQAYLRESKTLEKSLKKKEEELKRICWHLGNQRFFCEQDAQKSVELLCKKHPLFLIAAEIVAIEKYAQKGRPKADTPKACVGYEVTWTLERNQEAIDELLRKKGRFVVATNVLDGSELSSEQIIKNYKEQQIVEGGFRFLKDPWFMVDSFFVKKRSRIAALMVVMGLCLLMYNLAQHRLRETLGALQLSVPDQKGKPTQRPTMRWIFQLMEGVHIVRFFDESGAPVRALLTNLNAIRQRIVSMFGKIVQEIYGMHVEIAGM